MMNSALILVGFLALQQTPEGEAPPPAPAAAEKPVAEPPAEKTEPTAEKAEPPADEGEKPAEAPKRRVRKKAPVPPPAAAADPVVAPAPRGAGVEKANPERAAAAKVAIRFFEALIGERLEEMSSLCRGSFSFEGKVTANAEETRARWEEIFAHNEGGRYALYGVELLSASEAAAKYGKAPKRVSVPVGGFVAVGNLSGRPTVALLAKAGSGWQVVGIHD